MKIPVRQYGLIVDIGSNVAVRIHVYLGMQTAMFSVDMRPVSAIELS